MPESTNSAKARWTHEMPSTRHIWVFRTSYMSDVILRGRYRSAESSSMYGRLRWHACAPLIHSFLARVILSIRRFIYQDIPLYGLDEFARLAPADAGTIDEHELMKNRLEFEFAERTRYFAPITYHCTPFNMLKDFLCRADSKKERRCLSTSVTNC
jgi:hypothetical protein